MSRVRILSLALALAALAVLPVTAESQGRQQQRARVHTPAAAGVSLVEPQWVAQHAGDKNVRILDVRADPHDYFAGHVPNAVYLADATLRAPEKGLPVQFLPAPQLSQLLARAGVTPQHQVVVYSDGEDVLGATLVAYALEKLGHPKVAVMNGGFGAYKQGQKTTQEYPSYTPGKLPARVDESLSANLAQVKKAMDNPRIVLVDARPPQAYRGEVNVWMRNGHIPGAINLHWRELTVAGNPHQLKPVEQLREQVAAVGLKPEDDIIVYCGTGREASLNLLALRHVLGFPKVRLYEGSWTEYAAHPELPVATGSEPRRAVGGAGEVGQPEPEQGTEREEPGLPEELE